MRPIYLPSELEEDRADAEALMMDRCRINRPPTQGAAPDPDTLEYQTIEGDLVYEGPCRWQPGNSYPTPSIAGGGDWATRQPTIHIPFHGAGSADVRRDDVITLIDRPLDPPAAGAKVTVLAVEQKTWASARRMICSEGI